MSFGKFIQSPLFFHIVILYYHTMIYLSIVL
nr:MAG TPA: hypothetical protein [Bacteriophage sp.]